MNNANSNLNPGDEPYKQWFLDSVYEPNWESITMYLMFMLRDDHAVKEVFQETFLAAWTQFARVKPERKLSDYLRGICRNKVKDWLKKKKRNRNDTSLDSGAGEDSSGLDQSLANTSAGPLELAEKHELIALVKDLLRPEIPLLEAVPGPLSQRTRDTLVAYMRADFNKDKAAKLLGKPETTFKDWFLKAEEELRAVGVGFANYVFGSESKVLPGPRSADPSLRSENRGKKTTCESLGEEIIGKEGDHE
ncbi:RNA polymerase sigma factor [Humisphaera borealis]|uniref:Sigma-70 family RNA polymerase sigma factor n=1 Tax=Humisphaera borealis TaxID=2807512 RepID=A0A7M2WZL4_9BACT|nr:sigma-70 family RNA polymerase sigma factor [Humisphaera borealis]QOV90957.1 sigma-70 family RNA polymerase sigma factor [Humisphaera borealis]